MECTDDETCREYKMLTIKLCDFGLAVQINHPDEEHFTLCGTPSYIAPEIVSQKSSHGDPMRLLFLIVEC